MTESSASDASGDEHMSDDEEAIMKAQLKIVKPKQIAAAMKVQELDLKFRLKQKQRTNASQSSCGSNARSRTRLYGSKEAVNAENFDVFTPPQVSMEVLSPPLLDLPFGAKEEPPCVDFTVDPGGVPNGGI